MAGQALQGGDGKSDILNKKIKSNNESIAHPLPPRRSEMRRHYTLVNWGACPAELREVAEQPRLRRDHVHGSRWQKLKLVT